MVVAPLTANTLSKMVHGDCDNLLLATYLSAKCPVYFAPAMDLDMYKHPSTKANISKLEEYGNILIPSGFGELASGLVGEGRMAEPQEIIEHITADLSKELPLNNKRVLITAGPTYEAIDPVRFITNRSSGKMGYSIAEAAYNMGADVTLVSGIVALDAPKQVHRIIVESANEMYGETLQRADSTDVFIATAAVADYSPKQISQNKIKKTTDQLTIELQKNPDILAELSHQFPHVFTVGFAAE